MRRRIDEIDDRLQDLLIERVEIVSRVAAQQATQRRSPALINRRARRRSCAGSSPRNHGALPGREPGADVARAARRDDPAAGAFTVAVFAPPEAPGFWDLARDHYGSHTPMLAFGSAGQVIRAVIGGQAAVGVLPMPQEDEADPWWRASAVEPRGRAAVIARLPFGGRGNARADGADALAIGRGAQQPTGHDRTLLATENAPNISRGRLFSNLVRRSASLHLHCVVASMPRAAAR